MHGVKENQNYLLLNKNIKKSITILMIKNMCCLKIWILKKFNTIKEEYWIYFKLNRIYRCEARFITKNKITILDLGNLTTTKFLKMSQLFMRKGNSQELLDINGCRIWNTQANLIVKRNILSQEFLNNQNCKRIIKVRNQKFKKNKKES